MTRKPPRLGECFMFPVATPEARRDVLIGGTLLFAPGLCFVWGVYSLPGGMTYNAVYGDITYLYRPDKAFRRAIAGGAAYGWAWVIALCAMSLSWVGLLALGIGFFYTSVWAWSVVGYAFSKALALSDPALGVVRDFN